METREQLLALRDELRRLRDGGQATVPVADETLDHLKKAVATAVTESTFSPEAAATAASVTSSESRATVRSAPASIPSRAPATPRQPAQVPAAFTLPAGGKQERWQALRDIVLNDPMCKARVFPGKKIVFGVGSLDATIMFVGEAPGGDEEDQGEPFVGRAGQLLNKMIGAMSLQREQVYIGNILNWRPDMPRNPDGSQTGNRPPTPDEMGYCLPFIRAQIDIIQPKVLVTLGKTAVDGLLGFDRFKSMGAARGAWHEYGGTPLRATYHPSYLLRQEGLTSAAAKRIKRDAWEDLLAAMEQAGLPVSEKQRRFFL
jgi:DNA polymerase